MLQNKGTETSTESGKPRMRLVKEAAAELKAQDPKTALTEYALRRLVKTKQIPSVCTGNRYLINMDLLERYLRGELS